MQAKCKGVRTRRLLPGLGNPGRLPGRSGKFRSLKSDLQGVAWIVVEQGAVRSSRERNVGVEDWRVGVGTQILVFFIPYVVTNNQTQAFPHTHLT